MRRTVQQTQPQVLNQGGDDSPSPWGECRDEGGREIVRRNARNASTSHAFLQLGCGTEESIGGGLNQVNGAVLV
jgi:hypothetical protein